MDPNIFGGYEYAFIETKATWAAHEEAAITWGGHLASVHLSGEQYFIAQRTFLKHADALSWRTKDK